jgi:hypothetical protein
MILTRKAPTCVMAGLASMSTRFGPGSYTQCTETWGGKQWNQCKLFTRVIPSRGKCQMHNTYTSLSRVSGAAEHGPSMYIIGLLTFDRETFANKLYRLG